MKGVQTNATTLEGLYHVICCSRIRSASVISTLCHLHNGHNPKKVRETRFDLHAPRILSIDGQFNRSNGAQSTCY
jgi:hypothetical protein